MIISAPPERTAQRTSRRTVALSGLIGAGAVCTCWPLMFVSMIVGLTLGMPADMGGIGAPSFVAIGVSSFVVAMGAVGVLLGVRRLLHRSGVPRPLVVAVVGPLVSGCLYVLLNVGLRVIVSTPVGGAGSMLAPLLGAVGFALVSRVVPHRAATMALALASVMITAITWWMW